MSHDIIAQAIHSITQQGHRQKFGPGKLLGISMPQALYSSLYGVGQLESKNLLTVKDGCPVCYVLQTALSEEAGFPLLRTYQIMGKGSGAGDRSGRAAAPL
jgi:hypothetical protein